MIEAAQAGLVAIKARPLLWLGASLLYLMGALAVLVIEIGPAAPLYRQISDLMAAMGAGQTTPESVLRMIQLYGRVGMMTLVPTLIWTSLMNTAVYRAVLRPGDGGFLYLRLGVEEGRQLLVQLALWGVVMTAAGAVSVIVAAVAALAGPVAGLAGVLGSAVMIGVMLHLWARLSLATSATFVEGGLRLARSWRITEGHFWRILGTYALAMMAVFAVSVLWSMLVSAVTGGVMADMNTAMAAGGFDSRAFFDAHTAALLVSYVLTAPMGGLQMIITLAPGAVIYRALASRPA